MSEKVSAKEEGERVEVASDVGVNVGVNVEVNVGVNVVNDEGGCPGLELLGPTSWGPLTLLLSLASILGLVSRA